MAELLQAILASSGIIILGVVYVIDKYIAEPHFRKRDAKIFASLEEEYTKLYGKSPVRPSDFDPVLTFTGYDKTNNKYYNFLIDRVDRRKMEILNPI